MIRHFRFALILLLPMSLQSAVVLYDAGAPDLRDGVEITHWIQADQFTLAQASIITGIRFWDSEASLDFQTSIYWEIYADTGDNAPGQLVAAGVSFNLSHDATGRLEVPHYPEYIDNFDTPATSLSPGTYWLALHNGPLSYNANRDIFWETTANPANLTTAVPSMSDEAPFAGDWEPNSILGTAVFFKTAFQLYGVLEAWRPRITNITVPSSGAPRMSFTTSAGHHYRVEYKVNMTDASWATVSGADNIAGNDGVIQISDPDSNARSIGHRFYRAVLLD